MSRHVAAIDGDFIPWSCLPWVPLSNYDKHAPVLSCTKQELFKLVLALTLNHRFKALRDAMVASESAKKSSRSAPRASSHPRIELPT